MDTICLALERRQDVVSKLLSIPDGWKDTSCEATMKSLVGDYLQDLIIDTTSREILLQLKEEEAAHALTIMQLVRGDCSRLLPWLILVAPVAFCICTSR
jgi:hypothetical protein